MSIKSHNSPATFLPKRRTHTYLIMTFTILWRTEFWIELYCKIQERERFCPCCVPRFCPHSSNVLGKVFFLPIICHLVKRLTTSPSYSLKPYQRVDIIWVLLLPCSSKRKRTFNFIFTKIFWLWGYAFPFPSYWAELNVDEMEFNFLHALWSHHLHKKEQKKNKNSISSLRLFSHFSMALQFWRKV